MTCRKTLCFICWRRAPSAIVFHFTYDPDNKEKGRKIVLHKKSDLAKKQCKDCGKVDEHYTFQCPNDPDREHGVDLHLFCVLCGKKDDHSTWKCSEQEPIPFGPFDGKDMFCEVCGIEGEHWTDFCPEVRITRTLGPGFIECLICCKYEDSDHWTEDCPELADGDRKFCLRCQSLGDHLTDDCHKPPIKVSTFCACCELVGGHMTDDCPREANDGRKYCAICHWLGDHLTENCALAESPEPAATGPGSQWI